MKRNKALFFDKDGTIVVDQGYSIDIENIKCIPQALSLLRQFQNSGYLLIMVSNQSGISRGYFTIKQYEKYQFHLHLLLQSYGINISGMFHCPHHPDENCTCRKPEAGMLLKAAENFNIDLSISYMVGDKEKDVKAGYAAGCVNAYLINDLF